MFGRFSVILRSLYRNSSRLPLLLCMAPVGLCLMSDWLERASSSHFTLKKQYQRGLYFHQLPEIYTVVAKEYFCLLQLILVPERQRLNIYNHVVRHLPKSSVRYDRIGSLTRRWGKERQLLKINSDSGKQAVLLFVRDQQLPFCNRPLL